MTQYDPRAAGCACDVCPLRGSKVVPPEGSASACVALVGEAPGYHETLKLRPFQGPSGRLLSELFNQAVERLPHPYSKLRRDHVWVTNTLLCRPDTPGVSGAMRYDLNTYLAWVRKQNIAAKKQAKLAQGIYEPRASPLDACKVRLYAELNRIEANARAAGLPNGAVVIPLGNYATLQVLGRKGVAKLRGSPFVSGSDPSAFTEESP